MYEEDNRKNFEMFTDQAIDVRRREGEGRGRGKLGMPACEGIIPRCTVFIGYLGYQVCLGD